MSTVGALIEHIDPERRVALRSLLTREGMSEDTDVSELRRVIENDTTTRDEKIAAHSIIGADKFRFAPKLDFTQRCQVLALFRVGFNKEELAVIYGINRRTVTHIVNPLSDHYKDVKQEETGLGREMFVERYATDEVLARAGKHRTSKVQVNNKNANRKQGLHVVQGRYCGYKHRVYVQWQDQSDRFDIAGWYYKDLDGDAPDRWLIAGGNAESARSSMECYNAMLLEITDKTEITPP